MRDLLQTVSFWPDCSLRTSGLSTYQENCLAVLFLNLPGNPLFVLVFSISKPTRTQNLPPPHFPKTPGKQSFLWMLFEVRKKASHHPKQKIKADHLSSCHNRCNETSWSSLFIVFMLCSIVGIKTFHIIMWKLLSVYLIFRFFVGISALSARFQSAFCPFDDPPLRDIE